MAVCLPAGDLGIVIVVVRIAAALLLQPLKSLKVSTENRLLAAAASPTPPDLDQLLPRPGGRHPPRQRQAPECHQLPHLHRACNLQERIIDKKNRIMKGGSDPMEHTTQGPAAITLARRESRCGVLPFKQRIS